MEQNNTNQNPSSIPAPKQPKWQKFLLLATLIIGLPLLGWLLRGRFGIPAATPFAGQYSGVNDYPPVVITDDPYGGWPAPANSTTSTPNTGEKPVEWIEVEWYKTPKNRGCTLPYSETCLIVGKILSGEYKDKELFMELEPGLGLIFHYFPVLSGSELGPDLALYESKVRYSFKGIDDAPEYIDMPGTNYKMRKAYRQSIFKVEEIAIKLFAHPSLGDAYLMKNGCIMFKMPDQTALAYDFVIPFVNNSNGEFEFTFAGSVKNTETYQYNAIVGCGALCYYLAIIPDNELRPQEKLREVGRTSNNEPVYEFINPNETKLKELYEDKDTVAYYSESYESMAKSKYTYQEFLSYKPLLYWKDPLGRWVQFKNQRFIPAAEMCKPVIYLYPEKTTKLGVKVYPNGGFTYTEPDYGNGWQVEAYPDGKIIDTKTGREYPYLFWEGVGLNYPISKEGFVVSQGEIPAFLEKILPEVGLMGREKTDFMEYWVERLKEFPYYKLSFLKQEQFNEIAPLEFSGSVPDSFIRVLMTAKGLEKKEQSLPQVLPEPQSRHGFVFVEWGGVVLK